MKNIPWWDDSNFLKGKSFTVALEAPSWEERERRKKAGIKTPTTDQLNLGYQCRIQYRDLPRNYTSTIRFIKDKKDFHCELWYTYGPVRAGRFGKQRSVLMARYSMTRDSNEDRAGYNCHKDMQTYYFKGGISGTEKIVLDKDGKAVIKTVRLDPNGKLLKYEDLSRGRFNPRIVEYEYTEGKRILTRRRGKFSDLDTSTRWGLRTVRSADGRPLLDDGDFTAKEMHKDGSISSVVSNVGGRPHGIQEFFTEFGRKLDPKYFYHGTEIPAWVYRQPESIKVEEIIGESNVEVRRAMLELQGFEVFLSRARDKGLITIVDSDEDDRVGVLLRFELPGMGERSWQTNNKDWIDAHVFTLLKVKDGTLDKHYILRVPNNMKTARAANAWTWGLKEEEYSPAIER